MYGLFRKKKHIRFMLLIVGIAITIPIGVYALCKSDIKITSNITITNEYTGNIYRFSLKEAYNGDSIKDWFLITEGEINSISSGYEYVKDVNLINISEMHNAFYIKHEVVKDIITKSYVCHLADKEYCFTGNYETDLIKLHEFGEYALTDNGVCNYENSGYPYCYHGESPGNLHMKLNYEGYGTAAYGTTIFCGVASTSRTYCIYD